MMQRFGQSQRIGLLELGGVVAVAAHRSFRRAATEVGLSPSALSHAVATLEARLGVRLFQRTTRSVSMTPAGERFLERVHPALREIAGAMESVNDFRNTPAGVLRINASEPAAQLLFVPVVLPFLDAHPDMQLDLVVDGRFVDIVADGFDAGIRLREAVPRDMVAVPFGPPQRFAVVGSPKYFTRRERPRAPSDLMRHECVRTRLPSGGLLRWQFERRGEELTIDVRGSLTLLGSPSLALEAALNGLGLAYLPQSAVEVHVKARRLVSVLEEWTPPFPGFCLYYPHHQGTAGLRAFVDLLRAARITGHTSVEPEPRRSGGELRTSKQSR